MNRRLFFQSLALLGLTPTSRTSFAKETDNFYTMPPLGNARLLHFTDSHAQLLPLSYREPSTNIGVGNAKNQLPHLTGRAWLDFFNLKPNSREAYAFTDVDFNNAAERYGKMGGFAYLASLIKQLRDAVGRENSLLLDGGDTWQGSATALWSNGCEMVEVCNLLGVDVMTGHWEFTVGAEQLLTNISAFQGDFVAHNVNLSEEAQFAINTDNSRVFKPYIIKELAHARVAIIGQAFPFTPIAHPARFVKDWQFGIQERQLQQLIEEIQTTKQADVIVLLSHNGMDVDLKLASRIKGLDIIFGGHTHDAVPKPILIANSSGKTWVTNAGSHGKFLAVADLEIKNGRLQAFHYQLLPVFTNLLTPDAEMQTLINQLREPYLKILQQPLAIAETLLYRRDNFHGSFDDILLNALQTTYNTPISFSPGFRWGSCVLKGETIFFEDMMNHTAITYPETYLNELSGLQIKVILEDIADNLFNPDPYYQQGGDMVRVGGLTYHCNPESRMGQRISELRLANGKLLEAHKKYKVSGWAAVNSLANGKPMWEIAKAFLQAT